MQDDGQLGLLATHQNNGLFSNHYLDNRLPERHEWKDALESAERVYEDLQRRYEREAPFEGQSESQLERNWIRPIFSALGWESAVQVRLSTARTAREPDYILCRDAEVRRDIEGLTTATEDDLAEATAVADAKRWGRDLDHRGTSTSSLSSVPALQIDQYIRYSGLDWGILTNGRQWRLYHAGSSKDLDIYYEVDLESLLGQSGQNGAAEAFSYFYVLFRRDSFLGSDPFVDSLLEESRAYQNAVNEELEEQVFEALESIARGFFEYSGNDLAPTDENLEDVYDSSLILLYRLLFVLFAESRGLLPLDNPAYERNYSFFALKTDIAEDIDQRVPAAASVDGLWQRLTRLWKIIDKGNSELDVPAYNGGLFRADEHPFLEEHIIGDKHLRNAIDLLARSPTNESGAPEFVDYRDLNVRHLGSVYEGLLEYELRVADTNLSIVEHDGQENYEETAPSDSADVEEGDVFLITEGGERKRSGSYYTPDFVVRYIVDKTVGPVLEDLEASHQDGGADSDNPTDLIEAVLDVNVLDPAMGSGHFLVGVVDYIARFLVEVADAGHEDDQDKRDAETELAYWRRRVAQSCVYGVDQNPLAVELSKLSLWLRTVARQKPLSFLDHHLCVGNSLISSSVEDLPLQQEQSEHFERKERRASEAGQVSMMEDPDFAQSVRQAAEWMDDIEDLEGDTVEEVQRAEQIYEQSVRAATKEPRLIADVQTAREFGLEISDELFGELSHRILRGGYV